METQNLTVTGRREVAQGIVEWTLADLNHKLLPGYRAGAHVDVYIAPSCARAYSLTQPSAGEPTPTYVLAVALAPISRGGSAYMHQHLQVGAALEVGLPRNLFAMVDSDDPVLLIAGGIGITPLLAMARERQTQGRGWQMVLAARSRAHAAYLDELLAMPGGQLKTHFDNEHGGQPLDVAAVLARLDRAAHVYCCGPQPLMDKVREVALASGHPAERLHFESFGGQSGAVEGDRSFVLELHRSGRQIQVPAGLSILDALEEAGVIVPSVCREGNCGSCECMVIEGEVDHRDQILSEQEREAGKSLMICVSRARGDRLVIDV